MGLRDISLKSSYDSDQDDIVNDFYIKVLNEATSYDRIAGFFSSSSFYVSARGIAQFVRNGGRMRLIVGAHMNAADINAIIDGKEKPEEVVSRMFNDSVSTISEDFVKRHVQALAWMVAKGQLDIKVAIPVSRNGVPLTYEEANNAGLFHQKVGILTDAKGDTVSFSGSVNETASGWLDNIEEFKVFTSWKEGEHDHLNSDIKKFENYWQGLAYRFKLIDIPQAAKENLVKMAPDDFEKLHLSSRKKKLYDYQQQAVQSWLNNGMRGIFEMATGSGKTLTALGCLEKLLKKGSPLAVVITCPYVHLVTQWEREIHDFGLTCEIALGNSKEWQPRINGKVLDLNSARLKSVIVITTHDTFSSPKFMDAISKCRADTLLIADEMHGLGSDVRQNGLLEKYLYRLGLSATPRRWMDDEGTALLYDYFGKTVFEFTLKDAINKGFLTPYEYKPFFVDLTDDETEEYKKQTKKIAAAFSGAKNSAEKASLGHLFSIIRQKIIVDAQNKYGVLEKIIREIKNESHCLVYCSPNQIGTVQDMLNAEGMVQHKFTAEESLDERDELLKKFSSGAIRVLVAMKCLDEGVDVPATKYAVLMANSGNPKEFIQRRGRVLRKFQGKDKAIIYDIIVVPDMVGHIDQQNMQLENKIMKGEIRRFLEFAQISLKPGEAIEKIVPYANKYGIVLGD